MRAASRWAGAAVTDALEVIDALFGPVGNDFGCRDSLRQLCDRRRQFVENPMNPRAGGSGRVVTDEREALWALRDVGPLERGGDVFAVAGGIFGNGPAFGEGWAGEVNGHSNLLLFDCASIVVAGASDAEKSKREYGAAR